MCPDFLPFLFFFSSLYYCVIPARFQSKEEVRPVFLTLIGVKFHFPKIDLPFIQKLRISLSEGLQWRNTTYLSNENSPSVDRMQQPHLEGDKTMM